MRPSKYRSISRPRIFSLEMIFMTDSISDICIVETSSEQSHNNMAKQEYKSTNLNSRVASIDMHWHPEHILNINNSHSMKVATIKGDFIWHSHPDTDEVFYCVSGGPFRIELSTSATCPEEADKSGKDESVELKIGDVFCVPKGMQHRPMADVETGILMIEKIGTTNTGDWEGDERTVYVDEG